MRLNARKTRSLPSSPFLIRIIPLHHRANTGTCMIPTTCCCRTISIYAATIRRRISNGSTKMRYRARRAMVQHLCRNASAREAIALTCGMITMIDDAVGTILDTLEAQGLAQDTVIVFNSDHGDFLGDHGLILKGPMHFQSTIRVPLIWADPANPTPGRTSRLVSSIDLATTILARAGLTPCWGIQGIDLNAGTMRNCVLVEDEGNRVSLGFETAPRLRTLVTERFRMTLYQGEDWGELYDLETDPRRFQICGILKITLPSRMT
ncbi:MAG: sulfatase-like hydrolase/transferase [Nitratireductor sp.]